MARSLFKRVLILVCCAVSWPGLQAHAVDFQQDVMPLFKLHCVRCHGPNEQEGELNLSLPPAIARGGESGVVVSPGKLEESLLWHQVSTDEMPPDEPLSKEDKQLLRRWIESGAVGLPTEFSAEPEGDEHWAFQRLQQTSLPEVQDESKLRTDIDRFVQAKLEPIGLTLGDQVDRATLIRRVAFDLTGLPPTQAERQQFIDDPSDDAYEQMVDRYLASPHYGERWGKYWLDTAGYADSNGYFNADTDRPLAYRYRDYVIRSLNADKPFDQFIQEQLAGDQLCGFKPGDEVTPEVIELLEATHYLRNSPDGTDSSDGNPNERRVDKYAVLEGTLQIIGSSLLGITVQCARCHDHKFEPFSQQEYYQLQAIIYPAFNVKQWIKPKERKIQAIPAEELAAWRTHSQQIDEGIVALREPMVRWIEQNRERGEVQFEANFDDPARKLAEDWSNTVPGDQAPAGQPAIHLDSATAPGALAANGSLQIIESGNKGDRVLATKQTFDWTPNETGSWIDVTFDLLAQDDAASHVGYLLALNDFNDTEETFGGNVLIDGAAQGGAVVHVDYPGLDSESRATIGKSGYIGGSKFGVRIVNVGDNNFELTQRVDGLAEENTITLTATDLPDGSFGFEYCCGRSFTVDNLRIESAGSSPEAIEARKQYAEKLKEKQTQMQASIAALEAKRGEEPGFIATVSDLTPEPPEVFLLTRGDYGSPADAVFPVAPAAMSEESNPAVFPKDPEPQDPGVVAKVPGPRLAFARWLTAPDSRASALLARVTINRWWQRHFGTGLVPTVDNFGYSGASASHVELLDYLATELIESEWRPKTLHRLILHSAVYRQASVTHPPVEQVDPANRLLWQFPLQRLDAEAIRDAMLAVGDNLDTQMGGHYVPTRRDGIGGVVVDASTEGARRRSIYLQQRRSQVLGMLEIFDAPSIVFNCARRDQTTVPLQSLELLNSTFVRAQATAFASRLSEVNAAEPAARVQMAYSIAVGRTPEAEELARAVDFVEQQIAEYAEQDDAADRAWVDFCQAILSSNDFLYVK